MKVWSDLTPEQIAEVQEAEISKAQNELRCAQRDLDKAQNRLKFVLTSIHHNKGMQNNESIERSK